MAGKLKEVKDFKSTPYYEYYSKVIDWYCEKIIKSQMLTQWKEFDKKYSWNDVLKEVFKFANEELREFKDELNINPTRDEQLLKEENELIEKQINILLGN